jgi:hypothetical protein
LTSLTALSLAVAGRWLFAPLLAGAVIAGVYATLPIYVEAYRSLVKQRKVNYPVIAGLNLVGMWLGGFVVPATLGASIYILAHKLISKTEDHSRQRLANVFGRQPRTVWMVVDGVEVEAPFERVAAGGLSGRHVECARRRGVHLDREAAAGCVHGALRGQVTVRRRLGRRHHTLTAPHKEGQAQA